MDTAVTIVGIGLSATISLFIFFQTRRDKRAEERENLRQKQADEREKRSEERIRRLVECKVTERKYIKASGALAFYTARAVHNKKMPDGSRLCNGEVEEAMKYYKKCDHDLEDFYQESDAIHNT